MAGEIDGINNNSLYLASLQSANIAQMKNQKAEKSKQTDKSKRASFSESLKLRKEEESLRARGLPEEIQGMSVEDAAIYLTDAVGNAGEALKANPNVETLAEFKKTVSQLISYLVENNFEVSQKAKKGYAPPSQLFSKYNDRPSPKPPRTQVRKINEKLDQITRQMLQTQSDTLKMLDKNNILKTVDEIKGLVVDLLQG